MAFASGAGVGAALPTALRIDCRRPASWIPLGAAVITGWGLAAEGRSFRVAAGIACGGLLAVAAIGRVPRGVPRGARGRWAAIVWLRAGWTVVGFLLAAAAAGLAGSGVDGLAACGLAAASAVAATALVAVPPGTPRPPPAEMRLALMTVGVAAAAATAVTVVGGGPLAAAASAAIAWGLLVASLAVDRGATAPDWPGGSLNSPRYRSAELGLGIPMATALVAMAVCFFLAPQFAWGYTVLAVGWLVCLAAPPLADITEAAPAQRLTRSAAGRPLTPDGPWRIAATVGRAVAVLAWPAVVAALLGTIGVWPGEGPAWALAGIAGAAGLILLVAAGANRRGETAQAVILALAAAAAVFLR